ncbi:MAG TPA: hypothetical protein VGP99_03835 [Tepidisphaeraceae bacterium]|jgi:tetratricopeptide (TPR) repeat protein|nr:hypothetical protein [Tepidisphaeraceae bacterium]
MPEFEVNPPGICSICGEEKEPEELSELDGQIACLDCIAQANVSKNIPLEQIAAATGPTLPQHSLPRRSRFGRLITILFFFIIPIGGAFYMWHVRHRKDKLATTPASLKAQGDALARDGRLQQALEKYESVLKQLQGRPLSAAELELYHQTEKSAAAPYRMIIQPRLERVEALLLAGRNEEAREQFRDLANFINAHTIQPEPIVRRRIDLATDLLRVPRIAKANWRKEMPAVAMAPPFKPNPTSQPSAEPDPTPPPTKKPKVTPQSPPTTDMPPTPKPTALKPLEPVSVPDIDLQKRSEEQIRARFADNYAQPDPLARRALAHLLFITAQETTTDSTTRYVLLRESHDIAVRVAEPRIALAAVDEMAKSFLISDVAMRVTTLAESAQNAFTAEANELIAETALDLADRMAAEKHYDEAYRCAVIANTAAQQSREQALIAKTGAKLKELKR